MPKTKSFLILFAKTLRLSAWGLDNWYWLLAAACIVSPISPHIRLPNAVSYTDCTYVGTRGVKRPDAFNCPLVSVINTSSGEIVSW